LDGQEKKKGTESILRERTEKKMLKNTRRPCWKVAKKTDDEENSL